ncbi:HNH endonuclease [Rossellomorea aquimaris]|uniref:HNH endonuclease n=1 Tax=Rossellomorea aquimaris TaxID=189382 RepID=UPI0011E962D6|nr:HNH endonuclease signature motif containing protein [Rossellomorea aquimaris]TYS91945.1 HNH endonuclease [Rossellomorea aquimaris]
MNKTEVRKEGSRLRVKVLGRDEYNCRACGSDKELEVHHMKAVVYGGKSTMSNLIALCKECHRLAPEDGVESNMDFIENRNEYVYRSMMKSADINSRVTIAFVEMMKESTSEYVKQGIINEEQAKRILFYEMNKVIS